MTWTASQRFDAKVDKSGECWLWTGAIIKDTGYGAFRGPEGKTMGAHCFAYERVNGPISEGLELDHLCRRHECVRPDHLEAVTHAENVARGDSPGAIAHRTGLCKRGHDLADAYLAHRSNGKVTRRCRKCHLQRQRIARG